MALTIRSPMLTSLTTGTSTQPRSRNVAARLQKAERCQRRFACKAAKQEPVEDRQKAAADKAAEAAALAKGAAERAKALAAQRTAEAAAAPKPVSTPKPAPKPVEKPAEVKPEEPTGPELNYFVLIGGFLAIIATFYGFAAALSGFLVKSLFPIFFASKQ
uniref:Uncharacterized protein n=1 Tax=Pyramimonas obovata TaxID=1411642 RepID=A0A7S0MXD4_9CHLO|eukprot:CAMPEP_0118934950 /NCGR_PEP_ID=MMETSP1169-20130426/14585_1 /TAXON_ID=36882 /ORGANISM="Pyramimonas obovata, Strain CCMP722" /LENGTH=159 /DNA_ID=CAMNT_0006877915 /DNA_START=68 /DNA_END=550 /DNA_ORIENTATION=-